MRFALASTIPVIVAATFASATNYQVTVGAGGQLAFNPTNLTAQANDTITFTFSPNNHTVTQSNFSTPCSPVAGGIDSGFEPVSANATNATTVTFNVTVNDTNPVWFYCRQTGHCQKGMVFALNPTTNETFEAFQAAANASSASGSNSTNSSTSGSSPSSTTSASGSTSSNSAMGSGAQAGGLLAAVGFVAGILL